MTYKSRQTVLFRQNLKLTLQKLCQSTHSSKVNSPPQYSQPSPSYPEGGTSAASLA